MGIFRKYQPWNIQADLQASNNERKKEEEEEEDEQHQLRINLHMKQEYKH
jgi:hypothetical protein